MTHPNQQNLSFPDTIAVCLDEDKSVVCHPPLKIRLIFSHLFIFS